MRARTSVLRAGIQPREVFINRLIALGLGMVAGTALGAVAISQLQAQAKAPSAYAIVDISEITNPELMKQLAVKAGPAVAAAGGHLIARTENIVALDGTPPKRFVIIGFDGMDKAKSWYASPVQQEVNALAKQSQKSRIFVVEGMAN